MSEKSMSKDTRKNVILLHIAVMCFSCSGVIGQYVQDSGGTGGNGKSHLFVVTFTGNIVGV